MGLRIVNGYQKNAQVCSIWPFSKRCFSCGSTFLFFFLQPYILRNIQNIFNNFRILGDFEIGNVSYVKIVLEIRNSENKILF